ncbi:MAG: hypothetical protein M3487_09690 [Actinomycetota bacterium]|nr:hypothetical protein [Actinomycetota bacterium]
MISARHAGSWNGSRAIIARSAIAAASGLSITDASRLALSGASGAPIAALSRSVETG